MLERPTWAHRAEAPGLLPALLAGAWDDTKPGDRAVLEQLADRPYGEVEAALVRWANSSDPPMRKVGNLWTLVSKEDAWRLLSSQLAPTELERFSQVLHQALEIPDPALDLPRDQQWQANVLGHEHPLSASLREGLADTVAIMGARSGEIRFLTGLTGQQHANQIVYGILNQAKGDRAGTLWASLSGVLPLFAEAAPEAFLDAVGVALHQSEQPLGQLFPKADASPSLFARSWHSGLLWALETLAWSPEHLALAAQYLASLERLTSESKQGNRPIDGLRSIFLGWHPYTTAGVEVRLAALNQLRVREPMVAWELMLALLPKFQDIGFPIATPRWRDWQDTWREGATVGEHRQMLDGLVEALLQDVGTSGSRWRDLIEHATELPAERMVAVLEGLDAEAFSGEERTIVWTALRVVISQSRGMPGADWALPDALLIRLVAVYDKLTPADPVARVAWLFSENPDLLEGEQADWAAQQAKRQEARNAAIQTLYDTDGVTGLVKLARVAPRSDLAGQVAGLALTDLSDEDEVKVLELLESECEDAQHLARGYVDGRFRLRGWAWAEPLLDKEVTHWLPERQAAFLAALPAHPRTWDRAETWGEPTERAYWQSVVPPWESAETSVAEAAAEHLIRHQRPGDAVALLAHFQEFRRTERLNPALAIRALEEAPRQTDWLTRPRSGSAITTLLTYLAGAGSTERAKLVELEWAYLPLLEWRRGRSTLYDELATNPSFFVDVLRRGFRAHGESAPELDEGERAEALRASQLLIGWKAPFPGRANDGSVDRDALVEWVDTARTQAAECGRSEVADQLIGQILRYVPDDPNGLWPNRVVRDLVERIASHDLEIGLEIGLLNSRGVTSRAPLDGGAQERTLQAHYQGIAQQLSGQWPRSAGILRQVASTYGAQARREDDEAAVTEDRWRS
jgi:hypothetical protein